MPKSKTLLDRIRQADRLRSAASDRWHRRFDEAQRMSRQADPDWYDGNFDLFAKAPRDFIQELESKRRATREADALFEDLDEEYQRLRRSAPRGRW